jgi:hypothetical protein
MPKRPRRLLLTVPIALAFAACGPTVPTPPLPTAPATSGPTSSPDVTGSDGPTGAPQAGQADTEWGRIWDRVPGGFPRFPGSTIADDAAPEPASLRYVVAEGDAQEIGAWMQSALETATYSTEGLSGPFEDGSVVLDSVGDGDCRIQTTVAPLGGMTFVTVLYGAACPAP